MKYVKLFILITLSLLLGACSDEFDVNGNLQPALGAHYLSTSRVNFENESYNAFSETFKVESFETGWNFSDVAPWFSLSTMQGNTSADVTLDVSENNDATNARTAIFYLKSDEPDWDYNRGLSISQGKAVEKVEVDNKQLYFGGASGTQSVSVNANCQWRAACRESWVTLSEELEAGNLKVSVSPNPLAEYRSATVEINYGSNRSIQIKISQAPSNVESSDYTLQFENTASRANITIESESAWGSKVSDSWIMVTPENGGTGKTDVSIEVAPNTSIDQRAGYVLITTGGNERLQITIIQKGLYVETDQTSITFSSKVESKSLGVKSNTNWTVLNKPTWISLSKESGKGNDNITVTTTDNPSTISRNGILELGQVGVSATAKVEIIQNGKSVTPETRVLEFSDKKGSQTFNLEADIKWKSTNSDTWFTTSPTQGEGDATITVGVEENTSTEERTGIISYLFADKSTNVSVHQQAKYMTIENRTFEFDSKGGTHTIDILTNDEWSAEFENDVSWLTLSQKSGSGSCALRLEASDNASVNPRSAVLLINSQYNQSARILVSQQPRFITVSVESISFFSKGGESEPITINTNGNYKIESDSKWFEVVKGSSDSFTVKASRNDANEPRHGKILISLTDLKEGSLTLEITVMQLGNGTSFILNDFKKEEDWNSVGQGGLSITFKDYSSDQNWDNSFGGTLQVKVSGYQEDSKWD